MVRTPRTRFGRQRLNQPLTSLIGPGLSNAGPPTTGVREQIAELGGTRAAAQQLGRSERTIRRWGQLGQVPTRGGARTTFDAAVDANRNTPAYRQSRISQRRETRMRRGGARFKFTGIAGPVNDSPGSSIKRRAIDTSLSPEAMSDILDVYINLGDQAALDVLGDALAQEYIGSGNYGWRFEDQARVLDFLR